MGGDHSQKLLALEGNPLLSRAQTSGAQQHQHSNPKCHSVPAGAECRATAII